ncbi:nuclear transport factor 2 family protein [Phenylobacterium sp. LjRoot225]|uniref:nuclear transport factor 2 family protein n=1 Tax=Phenylobacterium sp. LjRoot225 TaxID=3342285 RepID=UPI003ED0F5FD
MTDFVTAETAIRQLHARCIDIVWRKDAKAFAECFAEDGEWKIAGQHMRGRAEIEALFAKLLGLCEHVMTSVSSPILEVGDGSAIGRTYVTEDAKLANGATAHTIGVYHEKFVETAEGWKFASRHWSLKYRGPADFTGDFYDTPDYGPFPGRPADDEPTTTKKAGSV